MQLIAWKDLSVLKKWPIMCQVGCQALHTHSLTHKPGGRLLLLSTRPTVTLYFYRHSKMEKIFFVFIVYCFSEQPRDVDSFELMRWCYSMLRAR